MNVFGMCISNMKNLIHNFRFYDNLRLSTESYYVNLRDAVKSNPIIIKDNFDEVLDMIKNGKYIFITQEDTADALKIQQTCGLSVFSEGKKSMIKLIVQFFRLTTKKRTLSFPP